MPLVKVRRAGQITLPAELREQFALEEGDLSRSRSRPGGYYTRTPWRWSSASTLGSGSSRPSGRSSIPRLNPAKPRKNKKKKSPRW